MITKIVILSVICIIYIIYSIRNSIRFCHSNYFTGGLDLDRLFHWKVNKNYSYLYCIKVTQITQWKIRCTDETGTSQYIENKLYRRLGSNPSLSADELLPRFRGALFYARNLILIEIPLVLTRFFLLGNFQPFLRPHF